MVLSFSGLNWGFTPGDVLSNAGSLFDSVAPYVLLGIGFMFAPQLIGLIKSAVFPDRDSAANAPMWDYERTDDEGYAWFSDQDGNEYRQDELDDAWG